AADEGQVVLEGQIRAVATGQHVRDRKVGQVLDVLALGDLAGGELRDGHVVGVRLYRVGRGQTGRGGGDRERGGTHQRERGAQSASLRSRGLRHGDPSCPGPRGVVRWG